MGVVWAVARRTGWLSRIMVAAALAIPTLAVSAPAHGAPSTVSDEIRAALVARNVPLTFSDPVAGPAALAAAGYIPSHGWVGFKGEGVAYGRPPTDGPFDLHNPPVLLYRPVPSGSFSDAQLSDQAPEPGYELVGVAYFQNYYGSTPIEDMPPESPPSLDPLPDGLRPTGGWFRHTAGCHMSSGVFVAFSENLPDPGLDPVSRVAEGTAWCQAVGINSTWVADGDVELGASGRCLLDRDLNPIIGSPRPVRPDSFVRMSAPDSFALPRPPDPGSAPTVVADPGPAGDPLQEVAFQAYQAAQATYDSAVAALDAWRTSLATEATSDCQSIGTVIIAPNVPTFWHGMAWDTHLFFDSDGSSVVGVNDTDLVPNGYVGPPFSFSPLDGALLPVAFPAPPQVNAGGPYTVLADASVLVTATVPPTTVAVIFGWDLDNSGTFATSGQTATFGPPSDAPIGAVFTITARACDAHGACTTDPTTVQVSSGQVQPVGSDGSGPTTGATPELDSLLLLASGLLTLGSYAATRRRARRKN